MLVVGAIMQSVVTQILRKGDRLSCDKQVAPTYPTNLPLELLELSYK